MIMFHKPLVVVISNILALLSPGNLILIFFWGNKLHTNFAWVGFFVTCYLFVFDEKTHICDLDRIFQGLE